MPETDKFGLLSLGISEKNDEMILEEKSRNPFLKKLFLESMLEEQKLSKRKKLTVFRREKFEMALKKALLW